ncbi:MAG: transcriptional regulator, MarR family [Lachnospiraceae bacterium]|jgi:DNA-binding MarR family transcriptional regulator|nr:transcriptional regulator, MarR family [Lachnospiraceae bacterium]
MNRNEEHLNNFLVELFNDILRLEETSLAKGEFSNLSISEMHVIDAVYEGTAEGYNTMTEIANRLMITASTLTTSVKTLEKKGYLERTKLSTDKRKVIVIPTDLAKKAYESHQLFHKNMVQVITKELSSEELSTLTHVLRTLHKFFKKL